MPPTRSIPAPRRPARRLRPSDPAEAQLRHVQRLAMQGELAATAVHEISNLLTIVLLNAGLLRELHKDDPEESKYLEPLLHAATLITKLCSQLRNLARTSASPAQPIDLVESARRTFRLLEQIMMTRELDFVAPTTGEVHTFGDPAHIDQLLFNLVLNARDATSEEGGRIIIRVGHGPRRCGFIEVEDNGIGMTAPVRRQLFRAFFTTKPPGQGTGLGLVTVQRLMQGMGGSILLRSRPGRGTRVRLQFPPFRVPVTEQDFTNGPNPAGSPAQPRPSP